MKGLLPDVCAAILLVLGAGGTLVGCTDDGLPEEGGLGGAVTVAAVDAGRLAPWRHMAIDGTGNNRQHPEWGSAGTELLRIADSAYADGIDAPAGAARLGPREISNLVFDQGGLVPNGAGASDFLWQWGQLLDHDLGITEAAYPLEPLPIEVPAGDPFFDPDGLGGFVILFHRSLYAHGSAPREQINEITAYIDASFVYGSDPVRADALRAHDGTGRLATSPGDLLPFNTAGLPNQMPHGADPADFFLAGDVRANEQVGLTALHVVFLREHNRLADELAASHPGLSGDDLYGMARRMVAAEVQAITYNEFVPLLLGPDALSRGDGYDPDVDPGIATEFSTAGFRVGHSLLSPMIQRIDEDGDEIAAGHLALRDAFFTPAHILEEGIEPILRGLAAQPCQEVDVRVVDEVRNFLFGAPSDGGSDLAALNLQRGRDHGLPDYNTVREAYGLAPRASFAEVTSDPEVEARLAAAYASPDDMDLWAGLLAEDHVPGAMVGELLREIVADQLERLRDGDRFFYRSSLPQAMVEELDELRLADVIRRNTDIGDELPDDVFVVE